ncbi:MAG: hypothetical protein LBM71_01945 [Elusimicrobiota bacterium]|jgi:hypothetical protein|nr:hypothetical protein [Elusimicrobiota bacterium]
MKKIVAIMLAAAFLAPVAFAQEKPDTDKPVVLLQGISRTKVGPSSSVIERLAKRSLPEIQQAKMPAMLTLKRKTLPPLPKSYLKFKLQGSREQLNKTMVSLGIKYLDEALQPAKGISVSDENKYLGIVVGTNFLSLSNTWKDEEGIFKFLHEWTKKENLKTTAFLRLVLVDYFIETSIIKDANSAKKSINALLKGFSGQMLVSDDANNWNDLFGPILKEYNVTIVTPKVKEAHVQLINTLKDKEKAKEFMKKIIATKRNAE